MKICKKTMYVITVLNLNFCALFSMGNTLIKWEEKQIKICNDRFFQNFINPNSRLGNKILPLIQKNIALLCDYNVAGFDKINSRINEPNWLKKYKLISFILGDPQTLFDNEQFTDSVKPYFAVHLSNMIIRLEQNNQSNAEYQKKVITLFDHISGKNLENKLITAETQAAIFIHVCFDFFWDVKRTILRNLPPKDRTIIEYNLANSEIEQEYNKMLENIQSFFSNPCSLQ